MPRPPRVIVPGAIYHVTARGVDRDPLYLDDGDYVRFVALLRRVTERFRLTVHAWCAMTTHYHLVVSSADGRLSRALQTLNSVYARAFNEEHGRRGHVFGERFRDTLVKDERHLDQACRYVLENPVNAGIVRDPRAWPWSECRGLGFDFPRQEPVRGGG
jgi:REP element-mobilizing transposase RayT